MTDEQMERYVDSRLNSIREEITQHFDSRVQEIQTEIDELRRSRGSVVSPDSDLLSRLDEVEIRIEALIRSLLELPPAKDWREKLLTTYKAIKTKRQQEGDAVSRELQAWFDPEEEQ